MAWEWVAPVAAGTTTLTAGVAGMFFTWLSGKQARDDARADAREARQQQRLENAYLELLKIAERAGQWAQMVYPVYQSGQPPSTPLPSLEVQADTEALVNAFGSAEVKGLLETWRSVLREMILLAEQVEWEEAKPATRQREGEPIARVALGELRPQERTTREALANQVAVELGHRTGAKPQK